MRVICNGAFDVLHTGHFNLLSYGRMIADEDGRGELVVLIDENEKIMAAKGFKRPIFDVHERAAALLDLKYYSHHLQSWTQMVDKLLFFHTDHELLNIVKRLQPDYLVKGSDWEDKYVVGSEVSKVLFYPRADHSTTDIVKRVLEKYNVK